jgi:hypothetical protein
MAGASTLLGLKFANPTDDPEKSKDEQDLRERSTKKKKEGEHLFSTRSSLPTDYTDVVIMNATDGREGSYRDKVIGRDGRVEEDEEGEDEERADEEEEDGVSMQVEECRVGDYECPKFIFSTKEEKRLYRPWRRGVIVKLLGRRIGYKALETRLKQMWVRKGIISIIDLGNDYFLVAFSHEDDQYAALMDGPWFIYDHYLTVKEWRPNFHLESDTIEEVAVWMRISGLPIEYYDSKSLKFIGDRVGKTVKIDKNTLTQERGKYARICVQVNLTKPLLAMFTIKDRKYNIEYEGLHLLCTTCGKFGHYKEGCPDKGRVTTEQTGSKGSDGRSEGSNMDRAGGTGEGPWRVVQKQKRSRKVTPGKDNSTNDINAAPAKFNAVINSTGSRFDLLGENNQGTNEESLNGDEEIPESVLKSIDGMEANQNIAVTKGQKFKIKRGNGGGGAKNMAHNNERSSKDLKLTTRGGGSFKGRTGVKKGVEDVVGRMGDELIGSLVAHSKKTRSEIGGNNMGDDLGSVDKGNEGPKTVTHPNRPQPPDLTDTPPFVPSSISTQQNEDMTLEGEVFEDANDQGTNGNSDAEMDIVDEIACLDQ